MTSKNECHCIWYNKIQTVYDTIQTAVDTTIYTYNTKYIRYSKIQIAFDTIQYKQHLLHHNTNCIILIHVIQYNCIWYNAMQTAVDTIQTAFDTIQSYKLKVRIRNDLPRSGESNLVTSISSCTSRSSSLIALHKVYRYSLVFHSWKRIFTPSINQICLLLAKIQCRNSRT